MYKVDGKSLTGLLYADDLILCGESEEDLRVMIERCVDVCKGML